MPRSQTAPTPSPRAERTPRLGALRRQPPRPRGRDRRPVRSGVHPALPPEGPVKADDAVLEMRFYWGQVLLSVHHYAGPRAVTIGEGPRADVFITSEGLPREIFPLVRFAGGAWLLATTPEMGGEVERNGITLRLAELAQSPFAVDDADFPGASCLRLPFSARAVVHWGGATFAFRFVPPPRPLPTARALRWDLPYLNSLFFSFGLHLAAVLTLLVYPYDVQALRERAMADVVVRLEPHFAPQPAPELPEPEPDPPHQKAAIKRPARISPRRLSAQPSLRARPAMPWNRASLRKLIDATGLGPSLLGDAQRLLMSANAVDIMVTHPVGTPVVNLRGQIQTGGTRAGGGSSQQGTDIETRSDSFRNALRRLGPLGPEGGKQRPMVRLLPARIEDALPRSVIQSVIDSHKKQMRYCYERRLHLDHELGGRVLIGWVIGATGRVAKATVLESSLSDPAVGRCIVERVLGWRFPAPAGGGTVTVSYGFVMTAL